MSSRRRSLKAGGILGWHCPRIVPRLLHEAKTGEGGAAGHALIAATYGVPQTAPGPLAWIDGACEWELNWRGGFDYPLQPPEAAIDPSEDAVSIGAAMAMRAIFALDPRQEFRVVLANEPGGCRNGVGDPETDHAKRCSQVHLEARYRTGADNMKTSLR